MQFRAAVLVVACATVGVLAARDQPGASTTQQNLDHFVLTGTWQLDEIQSKLSAENWRNRQISRDTSGPSLPTVPIGELALSAFGRALLEPPLILTIRADASSVSMDGRPRDVTTYRVDGQTHKVQVLLPHLRNSAPPPGRSSPPPRTETVNVKTAWVGGTLVQEMSSELGGTTFAMTQTLLPTDDGQQLFVMIDVRKPTLKPAVKPIRRVYVRSKEVEGSAPGSHKRGH